MLRHARLCRHFQRLAYHKRGRFTSTQSEADRGGACVPSESPSPAFGERLAAARKLSAEPARKTHSHVACICARVAKKPTCGHTNCHANGRVRTIGPLAHTNTHTECSVGAVATSFSFFQPLSASLSAVQSAVGFASAKLQAPFASLINGS